MAFDLVSPFDLDITLRDASIDPKLTPEQRMVANASIATNAFDGAECVHELLDAIMKVGTNDKDGLPELNRILTLHHDDYQRCLYYCLAGRGYKKTTETLYWLAEIMEGRSRQANWCVMNNAVVHYPVEPYIDSEPDGPLPQLLSREALGPSWNR